MSYSYADLGENQKAKDYASRALALATEAKDAEGQIQALHALALHLAGDSKSFQNSIPLLQEASSIAEQHQAATYYSNLQSWLGYAFLEKGMIQEAINAFTTSIGKTESTLERIPLAETRISFRAESLSPYNGLIEALFALYERSGDRNLAERALLVHEKSQARELAQTLTTIYSRKLSRMLPKTLYKEEQSLAREIDNLERELYELNYAHHSDKELLKGKEVELESKRKHYAKLMQTIQERYPQYAAIKQQDLGSVTMLPVRPREALVVYRVVPPVFRGLPSVFVWVITHSSSGAEIRSFGRISADIELVTKALRVFMRDDPEAVRQEILKGLSDILLKPALDVLSTVSHLTLVSDGALGSLPFEMLPAPDDSSDVVLDRWTVGYHPSLLSLVINRSLTSSPKEFKKKALLVGDVQYGPTSGREADSAQVKNGIRLRLGRNLEELPHTPVEIQRIDKLLRSRRVPTTILRRSDASESHVKRLELQEYRYLHFAVHGLLAYEVLSVGEPSLALAMSENGDDGFLTASEVMALKLNAEMVVLSACRTGLGTYHPGEGIANLARAFIAAGAKSVIASQWAVPDQSTAELMVELYANLGRGLPVPEALRAAKLTLRHRYPSPYYWAPFVLFGGE